jgi:hypothetical protein
VNLSQTDEQKHRALSEDFVDALMQGTPEEILEILKELKHLDGEAFDILVRLISGDNTLRPMFQNRLLLKRWSAGRPRSIASTTDGENFIIGAIRRSMQCGRQLKAVVAELMVDFKVSRSLIMRAWAKRPK